MTDPSMFGNGSPAGSDSLDVELSVARLQRDDASRAAQRVAALQTQISAASARCAALSDEHEKETRDVERMEGISLTRVVVAFSRHKHERLDDERAQRDAAMLRFATERSMLDALQRDLASASIAADTLGDARERYRRALAAKQAAIEASTDPRAARLHELTEQLAETSHQLKEGDEARSASQRALAALHELTVHLESASNWSTLDLFGGGMIASAIKRSRLDEANSAAAAAQQALDRLAREMHDVAPVPGWRSPDISDDQRFVDVWFDNIFTDWSVARKIAESRATVGQLMEQVKTLGDQLATRGLGIEQHRRDLESARIQLLDTFG